jgi:RHS repeat-associated protein
MKKILFLLVLLPVMVIGQTQNENYIKTKTYKEETATSIPSPTLTQANQNVTYFDGLGRPIQQVAHKQAVSATGVVKDIVTPIEYDAFGRQEKDYLPYAPTTTASLDYKPNALTEVGTFYNTVAYETTPNPYSHKKFEASPLNRVLKQAAPGESWKMDGGHEIKIDYQTNTDADKVVLFTANASWNPALGLYDISLGNDYGTVFYAPNQLYKTIIYDENTVANPEEANGSTIEFKNKEGKVVLKRTYNLTWYDVYGYVEVMDTYYVYDQFGNLTFVIPPALNENSYWIPYNPYEENYFPDPVPIDLSECYQYKYDYRNRLVEKKLPGKQWEFIVYDKLDRVVATGPAFSPFNDTSQIGMVGWLITKYDVFNRPVYTGWEQSTTVTSVGRLSKQNTMNGLATISESKKSTSETIGVIAGVTFYTNDVEPQNLQLLTVNYYDDYNFQAFTPPINYNSPVAYNNTTLKPKGLPTGSWVRVLTTTASIIGESSYILYDAKARPIRNFTTNYLGGYTQVDSDLKPFSGQLLSTITRHKRLPADPEMYIKEVFTYTDQDRLLTHTHQIGTTGTPQLLASNSYDELGQLISKQVGGVAPPSGTAGSGLQKVDYTYNIRGWLKDINNITNLTQSGAPQDLFAFKISYDKPFSWPGYGFYNGNISETHWKTSNDNTHRMYLYFYDTLNRLKDAMYFKAGSAQSYGNYRETLSYDKNGNILTLFRSGLFNYVENVIPIDDLYYTYNGNQLAAVSDATNVASGFKDGNTTGLDYSYDANGNMTVDKNKGITTPITYNHLNLPTKITFSTAPAGNIVYIYNAFGQKLEKQVFTTSQGSVPVTTYYLGGFQYVFNENYVGYATKLQFFPTAEGYVKNTVVSGVNNYSYVFNYTDHLGNVRLSYTKNPTTNALEILEESNYYPFGMKHSGYNSGNLQVNYKYKYNGKELQDELGLNFYDYGARNYDPALGRWMNVDPHSENYYSISPYASFVNNPVFFIDPTGEDITFWQINAKSGEWEQVSFNKLDKNVQKGILDFGKTKEGYTFLASFANAGDKIGNLSFEKDGKYSKHNFNLFQTDSEFADEGSASIEVSKDHLDFNMKIDKNMSNPSVNMAETIGHETFLHFEQDMHELIKTFDTKGWVSAFGLEQKQRDNNKQGYKDHLAVKDDTKGRAKKYFDYITQLKTVLNPNEVQKHVNKEIEKTYKAGKDGKPKK